MERKRKRADWSAILIVLLVLVCWVFICVLFFAYLDTRSQLNDYKNQMYEISDRLTNIPTSNTSSTAVVTATTTTTTGSLPGFGDTWKGKKVAWYGDSLTELYYHCQYVNEYFGFEGYNCGLRGTAITNIGDNSLSSAERMKYPGLEIPDDVEVIIIMAGTNDFAAGVSLGNKELSFDAEGNVLVDNTTFYGACHEMFNNMTKLYPDAYILVCGTPIAAQNQYNLYNDQNLTSFDYGDALCEAAAMWGIPSFNIGELMGVNVNNVTDSYGLMYEGIHFVDGGATMAADVIIQEICARKFYK